ncbi:MAG: sigma-54 dependent transcriptional regulator [Actinobacteria bacterium]|nr:sigma-54 dependent transcriptional regulator [Actinomycetota bacterium]
MASAGDLNPTILIVDDEVEALVRRAAEYGTGACSEGGSGPEWLETSRRVGFQVGTTVQMNRLASIAGKIARKSVNVLIQGETGTGKEVLARFIHAASSRSDRIFIPVNCGALPDNLLDSELFGHEKGAFTGASGQRKGIFELANQGTLFLDEIGEASPSIQVKLLRVLETGEFLRIGGEKPIRTDVRIIAATNVDLEEAVRGNLFREDLFYRLDVVRLTVPPLRDRRNDIPQLVSHFIKRNADKREQESLDVSPGAMELFMNYGWPGNVRELSNTVEQAVALCDGPVILPGHIPEKIASCQLSRSAPLPAVPGGGAGPDSPAAGWTEILSAPVDNLGALSPEELYRVYGMVKSLEARVGEAMDSRGLPRPAPLPLRELEASALAGALAFHNGNITLAARTLGIGRNTLYRKLKEYKIPCR